MRRPKLWTIAAITILLATWLTVSAQQSVEESHFVLTEREAFLLGNPQIVVAPHVTLARWSSDGRYVLAARVEPDAAQLPGGDVSAGEVTLVLWSSRTRRSQVLWKEPLPAAEVERIEWLPGMSVALVIVRSGQMRGAAVPIRRLLLRLDASRSGTVRVVSDLMRGDYLLISPERPLAFLGGAENVLRVVRTDGSLGVTIRTPGVFSTPGWKDGYLVLQSWENPPPPAKRLIDHWHSVDPLSGQLRPLEGPPKLDQPRFPSPNLSLRHSAVRLREADTSREIRPVWLAGSVKGEGARALVSADSEWALLAPDDNAVLYDSQGAAWVLPFHRVPREAFVEMRRIALQRTAVSNARQIGTALMMYIEDYDNLFPPSDMVNIGLGPYLKNKSLLNTPGTDVPGFVYLQSAVPLKELVEPAKTLVGYLPGPDGRALIYADGHVVWEDALRSSR
jgi:hypothetical protein